MKKSAPFYITVIDEPVSSVWYKKTPMGKNAINTIMKEDSIKNITCHVSVQGLDNYDLGKNESSRSFHEPLTTPVLFLQETL